MEWLNLNLSFLSVPEYVGSGPVQRATWLNVVGWCCRVENMGVIKGCRSWGDRRWMQTCGVTIEEVQQTGELYWFDGDDLHVFGYPVEAQNKLEVKRKIAIENGKKGGRRKTVETDVETEPETDMGTNVGSDVGTDIETNVGKRKGREGKERKENINNHQSSSSARASAGAGGESPLAASIAAAEDIPEAVPVNPAPPQPPRRPSCAEPYPETVEEVEKAMLATTGLRPQGDDLKECAAAYLDDRSIRGWMTKTANPVPIADWRRDCLNFARLWATNNQKPRKTDYPPLSPGTPPQHKSRCGPITKGSFDWNGKPAPLPTTPNQKQQTPQ